MTDPTPEERAYRLCSRAYQHADVTQYESSCPRCKRALDEIRVAIEADRRERLTHRIEPGMCGLPVNVCTGQKERIAQLEAQLRETEQQVLASHQANRELEEKLRERAEDTERLDWLEHTKGCLTADDTFGGWVLEDEDLSKDLGRGATLREAIDAARAQESGE